MVKTTAKKTSQPRRLVAAAMMLGTAWTAMTASPASASVTDLTRYCTACWRNARLPADCWADCTQDVFVRLLERVPEDAWPSVLKQDGDEHRELVRAIDTVKKRVQRARRSVSWTDVAEPQSARSIDDRMEVVDRAAERVLSDRQRTIVAETLRGYTVPDIAAKLATSPERVSDEKYKAIRKLQAALL